MYLQNNFHQQNLAKPKWSIQIHWRDQGISKSKENSYFTREVHEVNINYFILHRIMPEL